MCVNSGARLTECWWGLRQGWRLEAVEVEGPTASNSTCYVCTHSNIFKFLILKISCVFQATEILLLSGSTCDMIYCHYTIKPTGSLFWTFNRSLFLLNSTQILLFNIWPIIAYLILLLVSVYLSKAFIWGHSPWGREEPCWFFPPFPQHLAELVGETFNISPEE